MALDEDVRIALKRSFADFLERDFAMPDDPQWNYSKGLSELYQSSDADGNKAPKLLSRRLMVHEHHLREFDERLLQRTLQNPSECLPAFEDAVKDLAKSDSMLSKLLQERDELHVGLKGDFGKNEVSPRELTSDRINQMVCVFGIVTKCSLVRPKVCKSVHYCDATKLFTTREYRDVTSMTGAPTGAQYPTKDDNGNLLTTEYGLSVYKDSQMVTIQELPETAPPGQMPHSTDIVLEDDLVDKVKPGDRVSILGIYKAVSGSRVTKFHGGIFKAMCVGISVQKLTRENTVKPTIEEVRQIRALASRPDVLQLLGNSLAPSIYGHDIIKRGLVLQMMGGLEKNLKNGTHLRGDINCLLVGDPGVAKSQMLRACMNIAPHSVSTTGRGCSGVGLTAAVTHDNETGEKRLEAGAMVLADRGMVCIDEFDKMSDQDRVAIHEVMEQQTVTIAKAGIHCSLNARCSVLAAANPLYGSYDKGISVMRNVNLPDSLLSRFDMLFVVLDQMNDARDRQVAMHVIRQHRYRPPGEDGRGAPVQETIHDRVLIDETQQGGDIYMRQDARLHGGSGPSEVLTSDFLRKYIIFVRRRYSKKDVTIDIEDAAAENIVGYYADLRSKSHHERALPVTARSLETIIRIATASCKLRLAYKISVEDVQVACSILDHVMKKEVGSDDKDQEEAAWDGRNDAHDDDGKKGGDNMDDDDDDEDGNEDGHKKSRTSQRKRTRRARADASGAHDVQGEEEPARDEAGPSMDIEETAGPSSGPSARTKRQRTARAVLGFPAEAVVPEPPRQAIGGLTAEQKKTVNEALAELRDTFDGDIPVSELAAICLEKKLIVTEDVLMQYLLHLYDTHKPGCGLPEVMISGEGMFIIVG